MGVLADWQVERDVKITPFVKEQVSKDVVSYGLTAYGYDARCGWKFKIFHNLNSTVIDPKNFNPHSFMDVDLTPLPHEWIKDFKSMRHPIAWDCQQCKERVEQPVGDRAKMPDPGVCPALHLIKPNYVLIPPNSFALAETVEHFEIPRDCLGVCLGKSTYARCGIIINVTPLEPEWCGKVTVEISNTTPLPAKIYAGEGIMQINFYRTDGIGEMLLKEVCNDTTQADYIKEGSCKVSYADKRGRYQDQTGLTLPFIERGDDEEES